jgi:uncharacterized protein YbjT (DUF2867 family)
MILVTTANGMFGNRLVEALSSLGCPTRAMVRDRAKFGAPRPGVEVVAADLDRPETLGPALRGVDAVFLASPMHPSLKEREIRLLDAAKASRVRRVVRIHGAVRHGEDLLGSLHMAVIDHLKASGMEWTLVSPNSVMETSLLGYAPSVRGYGVIMGMSGRGKIGLVALDDTVEVAALALTGEGHHGQNYEITGPEALDLYQVAEAFTRALGRPVAYQDLPEAELKALLQPFLKMSDEEMDINVLCHLRCWRDGKADLVTDTYTRLTGKDATSVERWVASSRASFS